ncbi:MAG: 16S rRNA (cytosine(1402)-N(4))-methyltransferase RsmH [Elusimicrobiota bacterium]|nr:16S rRNA (cytosine(1402)-N(4))-methyltransferase RsmH [Elusimicrobiota bacterium]
MQIHIPVLTEKVIEYLKINPESTYIDATIGTGGHAGRILEELKGGVKGRLIGLDCDIEAVKVCQERFKNNKKVKILHRNFSYLSDILKELEINSVDGILFDLGVSTLQFTTPERGFSFRREAKLDMRMDRTSDVTAYDIVNNFTEEELEEIFKEYGEERWSKRIALKIIEYKNTNKKKIETTTELAKIIENSIPKRFHPKHIHPATRVFQALRIAVNDELNNLKKGLSTALKVLNPGGRIVVISYHSLEDRIVKQFFYQNKIRLNILTKKPVVPDKEEIEKNHKSRSAKLRAAVMI